MFIISYHAMKISWCWYLLSYRAALHVQLLNFVFSRCALHTVSILVIIRDKIAVIGHFDHFEKTCRSNQPCSDHFYALHVLELWKLNGFSANWLFWIFSNWLNFCITGNQLLIFFKPGIRQPAAGVCLVS